MPRHNSVRGSSAATAAQPRSAEMETITRIARRLGVVLGAALDCACSQLASSQSYGAMEQLRDEMKPIVDALVHFPFLTEEGDSDEA